MAKLLKLRRGSTTQHASFTGAEGEVTIDTTKDTAVVHDGAQAGGRPLAREDMSNVSSASIAGQLGTDSISVDKIAAGTLPNDVKVNSSNIINQEIIDADVSNSAGIAGTKVSPNFGSQNVVTTGNVSGANLNLSSTYPSVTLEDTNNNSDYRITNNDGQLIIYDITNTAHRLNVNADGHVDILGNLDVGAGIDVTGKVAATGEVEATSLDINGTTSPVQIDHTGGAAVSMNRSGKNLTFNANYGAAGTHSAIDTNCTDLRLQTAGSDRFAVNSSGASVTGNITATGEATINGQQLTVQGTSPRMRLVDTDENSDFQIKVDGGSFVVEDITNSGADRFVIDSNGTTSVAGNLDVGGGVDVTGNITVTGTVDGRDVAADGSKLDGIDAGAKDDQTKAEIDALNINADQVDGLHGHQFLRSDTNDTMAGNLNVSGAITSTGTLTVMSTQNSSDIYMNDSDETTRRIHCNSNRVGFLKSNNSWGAYCDNSGNWVAEGNVTAYSDARLKTDISTINDALGIVGKLRGVSYKWLKDGSDGIGVIAQEVEEVLPEVVVTGKGVNPVTQEIEEVKSVDYGKIVGVLINAINELKAEVDELKGGK